MNTQQITATILRALHEQIDPMVEWAEARMEEQGYACCHTLTVRAGSAKAAQFAAALAALVEQHNRIVLRATSCRRGEYRSYLLEQAEELRPSARPACCGSLGWTSAPTRTP